MTSTRTDPRALDLADRVFEMVELLTRTEEYQASDADEPLGRLHVAASQVLRHLSQAAMELRPEVHTTLLRTARRHAADAVHLLVPLRDQEVAHAESLLEAAAEVVRDLDLLLRDLPGEAEA
jgi:hypothetical protein